MAGVEQHHDLVGDLADATRALGDLLVGDGLVIEAQQAFFAAGNRRLVPARAVAREVDEDPPAFGGRRRQLLERVEHALLGGLRIAQHGDALVGDAHRVGDRPSTGHVDGHAGQRRDFGHRIGPDADDQRAARGFVLRLNRRGQREHCDQRNAPVEKQPVRLESRQKGQNAQGPG